MVVTIRRGGTVGQRFGEFPTGFFERGKATFHPIRIIAARITPKDDLGARVKIPAGHDDFVAGPRDHAARV